MGFGLREMHLDRRDEELAQAIDSSSEQPIRSGTQRIESSILEKVSIQWYSWSPWYVLCLLVELLRWWWNCLEIFRLFPTAKPRDPVQEHRYILVELVSTLSIEQRSLDWIRFVTAKDLTNVKISKKRTHRRIVASSHRHEHSSGHTE